MYLFASFPFFFWRVSSEGGFSPLFSFLHWVPVCQNVFLIPLVGLDIPYKYNWQGRRFHPKRPFLPSTKDRPSESRPMRDRYP